MNPAQEDNLQLKNPSELIITELFADEVSILMESILNPWSEDDNVVQAFMANNYTEPVSLKFWQLLVSEAKPTEILVDVGAYTGIYSLFAAKMKVAQKIVGFEPSAVTFGRYVQNISLNRAYTSIVPCNLAASNAEQILIMPHLWGLYTLCSGESLDAAEMDHSQPAFCLPLDSLLTPSPSLHYLNSVSNSIWPFSRIAAIKIDVEGAELVVLEGALQLIARDRPVIIAEALDPAAETKLASFAASIGYNCQRIGEEWNFALFEKNDANAANALQKAIAKPAVLRGIRRLRLAI